MHRDHVTSRELFDTLLEAKVLIESWSVHDNTVWLHSSPGDRPPAPEAVPATRQSHQITT